MRFAGVLPENVCSGLAQLVESAIAAPAAAAAASDALILSKISALRCCFDDAVSRVLTARNAKRLILPDDIWPLVLEHLPLDDLLSASRTCRSWRALSLAHSRLWTRLILYVDQRGSSSYATNINVLKRILPRARHHLLELEVRIALVRAVGGYDSEIGAFLELVAPRLAWLQMTSEVPWFVGQVLDEYFCGFPELLELSAPPPSCGCSGTEADCYTVLIEGACLPKLVHLDLHSDLRLMCYGPLPTLRTLRCNCEGVVQLEDLFLSARGLRRLTLGWTYDWDSLTDSGVSQPSAALITALRALPDVEVTAELDPAFEDVLFDIFGSSPAPRLRLVFKISEEYTGPLKPRPCNRLSSAVRLTISVLGDDTVFVPDDGTDRETMISLRGVLPTNALHPSIDWAMIPSFGALEHLSVDAALWPDLVHKFPNCPRLAEITLAVRSLVDIQAVLAVAPAALPQADSLTLTVTELCVELLAAQVDALKKAFGASHVSLK